MPFDDAWFEELRGLSRNRLDATRNRGIERYVPHVGELRRGGHISERFLEETERFVRIMSTTPYRFDTFFRADERHVFNFPRGRASRSQWNIAFTAGDSPDADYVRIGIGFRLSGNEEARGLEEYLEFREQVHQRHGDFDQLFQHLGNYYECLDWEPQERFIFATARGALSLIIVHDQPPLEGWRFFGRCLRLDEPHDRIVVGSHERLRDAAIDIYNRIQHAGFGM